MRMGHLVTSIEPINLLEETGSLQGLGASSAARPHSDGEEACLAPFRF